MPDWKQIVRERLAGLKLEGSSEAEICEELAQHLEDRYRDLLSSGIPEPEAQQRALEPLNDSPSLIEALRCARKPIAPEPPSARASQIAVVLYDFRIAMRGMCQKPGFSFLVIGMLALAIAGNAAIFSAFNSFFLKPLPFPDSSRLIDLDETAPRWNLHYVGISEPDLFAWRDHNTTFDSMAFFRLSDYNLSKIGPAQHIRGAKVTRDMLKVLRLKPIVGRNFLPEEDRPNGERVTLLGYGLWHRLFSGNRDVLGRLIVLDDQPYKIVGVLPREAVFPDRAELWVPLAATNTEGLTHGWGLSGIGRLKHGVSIEQASADLLRAHRALLITGQKANEITAPILTSLRVRYLGDYRTTSQVLLVAVGVVLLIACVNIAALLFVRASARSHEIAIRTAIGATRGRIVWQLLTENAVLAATGGAAGALLGRLGLQAIVFLLPEDMPHWIDFHIDSRFAAFCILITAAAALLFGLSPALQASRADVRGALHEAALRATLSRARRSTLNIFVICEVGLALALLISSGLLVRAFDKVTHVDPGFRPENVLTFGVDLPEQRYPKGQDAVAFYRTLLNGLRGVPGVVAAGAAWPPPMGGSSGTFCDAAGGPSPRGERVQHEVLRVIATPGYFDAIGMTLLAGRQFDMHDGEFKNHPVAIVNEAFAHQFWPGASVVGKQIRCAGGYVPPMEVIGVLGNEKHDGLDDKVRPAVYQPQLEWPYNISLTVVLRTHSNPEALATPARRILERIDPDLPMYAVHTMTEQLDRSLWARRAYSWLFGIFSLIALILAAGGIYGVISYAVTQRTHEIGIRIAVGASPGEVLASVLRGGMVLVAVGAAIGVAVTLATASLLDKLLFGVSPRDPLVYTIVVLVMATVGLLANAIPAWRAAAVDPVTALRTE
ncbi:MAG: ADOP family duplicated permease [Bryobacteraceae bacterium]